MSHPSETPRRPAASLQRVPRFFALGRPSLALLACLLRGQTAGATPEYPGVLDQTMQSACPNPEARCLICHTRSTGGKTTATQPFALSLRDYGLVRGRDPGALVSALASLPDLMDSDLDGAPDKEELGECLNPSGSESGIDPVYGCGGASLASGTGRREPLLLLLALAFGTWLFAVRARRGRFTDRGRS